MRAVGDRVKFTADEPAVEPDESDAIDVELSADAWGQFLQWREERAEGAARAALGAPWPVRAGRPLPNMPVDPRAGYGRFSAPENVNPLRVEASVLDALQFAIDERRPGGFVAAEPQVQFATLTTSTLGAGRVWGSNVLRGPRLLHVAAGVPRQPASAIYAQFPQLTLPTASAAVGEGVSLVEYASSTAGSLTMGRLGRWTDLSTESMIGADAGSIIGMHQLGIALDMDTILINAVEAAAGGAVAFTADVPAAIRTAIATVMAATATDDPSDIVILVNPANAALLQDVTPTGGQTIAERFQRFSGALVYPSLAADTGFATVANLRVGARYFEARGLFTASDIAVKTSVETIATFLIAGYGITLTTGFASKVDVVTP